MSPTPEQAARLPYVPAPWWIATSADIRDNRDPAAVWAEELKRRARRKPQAKKK